MPAILPRPATVYYSPTKRRRYLTARSAANAEASAKLTLRYPTERGDESDGYHNWHWSADPRLVRAHKRYARLLLRALREQS